jgi:hypothetical protein
MDQRRTTEVGGVILSERVREERKGLRGRGGRREEGGERRAKGEGRREEGGGRRGEGGRRIRWSEPYLEKREEC